MNTNRKHRTRFVVAMFAAAVIAAACSGEPAQTTTVNDPTATQDSQATEQTAAPTDTAAADQVITTDSSTPTTTDDDPSGDDSTSSSPTTEADGAAPAAGDEDGQSTTSGTDDPDVDDSAGDPDAGQDPAQDGEPASEDDPADGEEPTGDPAGDDEETAERDPDGDEEATEDPVADPDEEGPAEDETPEEDDPADDSEYPTTATEAREAGDLLVASDQPNVILGGSENGTAGYGANAAAAGQCNNCTSDTPAGNQLTQVYGLVGSPNREPIEVWVPPATGTTRTLDIQRITENLDDNGDGFCALGFDAVASARPGDEIVLQPSSDCQQLGLDDISLVTSAAGVTHRVIATQRFVLTTQTFRCTNYFECDHLPPEDFEYRVLVTCMLHPKGSGAASNHGRIFSVATRHDPAGDVVASGAQALAIDQWTWHNGGRANTWVTCGEGLN
ncbi:hypothetical protein [Candidatus Poriferisodalis sp.]|uniref:hypothetical protein n=1 Tax=Candidatus Poriferisodalis sp. TaxID=3101277 RepID=UPI003B024799